MRIGITSMLLGAKQLVHNALHVEPVEHAIAIAVPKRTAVASIGHVGIAARARIEGIEHTIIIIIRIAHIALCVAIAILLAGIRNGRTIVANVTSPITISIALSRVCGGWTVVAAVTGSIMV